MDELVRRPDVEAIVEEACEETARRVTAATRTAHTRDTEARRRRHTAQLVAVTAVGIVVALIGWRSAWMQWTPTTREAWTLERTAPERPDTKERWVLTIRQIPQQNPGWFPMERTLTVQGDSVLRLQSEDLQGDLPVKVRHDGSRESEATIPRNAVRQRKAYIIVVGRDAQISFWAHRPMTLTIDVLTTSPRELEQQLIARKGTIHPVR